jgi:hypothetical protein
MLEIIELEDRRAIFGNDSNAINRHSTREYVLRLNGVLTGQHITLDRLLDAEPRYFSASANHFKVLSTQSVHTMLSSLQFLSVDIPVAELEQARSWQGAEARLPAVLKALGNEQLDLALRDKDNLKLIRGDSLWLT